MHGVYLHLPPARLTGRVLNTVKPEKDVDGYERKVFFFMRSVLLESLVCTADAALLVTLVCRRDGAVTRGGNKSTILIQTREGLLRIKAV